MHLTQYMRHTGKSMLRLLFLLLFILSACSTHKRGPDILSGCQHLKPLTRTKHPPQPGEWRSRYTEIQEPVKAYCARNPTAATPQRTTLYVVQLGRFDAEGRSILEQTKTFLSSFFQIPVAELPTVGIGSIGAGYQRQNSYGLQLQTRILLDSLLPALLPDSAFALLAFTPYDLYPDDNWNFVFGQASTERRIGVWSLARLGDYHTGSAAYALCLKRTIQVAAHETGHMFGIGHCVLYECCMNGSNSLSESDRQPSWLCWECLAKVCFNRRVQPERHVEDLLQFYRRNHCDTAALAYYTWAAQLLKQ
ncbi:archaemetzincin [Taibaiella koreensis]|uniref:archaemetzincin n=1 Tax=Taibaiella koreensis TaxID=1268548 RepID=UPI000E59C3DA|nr:archaemetzincin [Taibaiella koreensis]